MGPSPVSTIAQARPSQELRVLAITFLPPFAAAHGVAPRLPEVLSPPTFLELGYQRSCLLQVFSRLRPFSNGPLDFIGAIQLVLCKVCRLLYKS
jgi:hypothetical protein